jgi:inorganic pyrophosphatase
MTSSTNVGIRQVASKFTLQYRAYLQNAEGKLISPFHDIPLFANSDKTILNMVVEVPRFSNAKLEISKEEWMNPIKQDVKKGALRFVKNCFPYHGYLWNYGALPQTWESPLVKDSHTGFKGDNDPIDVLEIGSGIASTGQVKQVKVLGALAMLDEGETDWKIIAIDVQDPLAGSLHDASDLETYCPGLLEATRRWFRIYKVPDGKPENEFAFGGAVQSKEFAMKIVQETHEMWKNLIAGGSTGEAKIAIANRTIKESPGVITGACDQENEIANQAKSSNPDAQIPESVNGWAFVNSK